MRTGLLLPVVLVVVACAVAVWAGSGRPVRPAGRLAAVDRSTRRWRVVGLLAGLVVAGLSWRTGTLGRGPMLAAPLAALCVLLGVVAGELRVGAPAGATRSAALEVRRVRDYVPPVLAVLVATATVLLLALLVVTTALGSADDLGRAGRTLARRCSEQVSEGRGPWPGSYYSLPLAAVVLAGAAVAAVALRRVVQRPRQGEDVVVDDALRRHAATSVTSALGLLVAIPFAGVAVVASIALLGICAAPPAWTALGRGLLVAAPLLVVLGAWCAAQLVLPARVREPAAPGR